MIKVEVVIHLHGILIDKFGGIHGVRDYNALESAINRPFMTFDQKELYLSPIDKATALIESLISNHQFICKTCIPLCGMLSRTIPTKSEGKYPAALQRLPAGRQGI